MTRLASSLSQAASATHVTQLTRLACCAGPRGLEWTPVSTKESTPLFQAKLVNLGAETFFVLCSTTGMAATGHFTTSGLNGLVAYQT